MKNTTNSSGASFIRGFTLIEMMVVIAIIAILTGIIVTNLSGAKGKARDAKRISDIGQIQLALELFYDRCDRYPTPDSLNGNAVGQMALDSDSNDVCSHKKPDGTSYKMSDFIATIPIPPTPLPPYGSSVYRYFTNQEDNGGKATDYVITAELESPNSIVNDSIVPTQAWFLRDMSSFNCGTGTHYCLGPK